METPLPARIDQALRDLTARMFRVQDDERRESGEARAFRRAPPTYRLTSMPSLAMCSLASRTVCSP